MVEFLNGVAILVAVFLSWQDWQHTSVPLIGILFWLAICALLWFFKQHSAESAVILFILTLFLFLYQFCRKKQIVAAADLIVLFSCSIWLDDFFHVLLFLMLSGFFGLLTAMVVTNKRFPFLPAIFLSAFSVYFFNLFGVF